MGFGGVSLWQLLIVLVIVILLFGTKKIKSLGSDLGSAIKGFKNSVSDTDDITNIESKSDDADFAKSDNKEKVNTKDSKD